MTTNPIASLVMALSWLTVTLSLVACGGGGGGGGAPADVADIQPGVEDGSSDPDSSSNDDPEARDLFPEPGPIVDPASSPTEIASRADLLLDEYRTLMDEVFDQMDEVYRTIGSGLPTSEDQELVATDARFYETITTNCAPEFDETGTIIALRRCSNLQAMFRLRHPLYSGVRVLVSEYGLGAAFEDKAETEVSIHTESGSLRIETGPASLSTDDALNPPSVRVDVPAYSLGENCSIYLAPTRFPEDDLGVNACSELLLDALTVLRRLNDR